MFFLLMLLVTQVSLAQVYISPAIRCSNYGNSCVHASTVTCLNYLRAPNLSRYIRNNLSGGDKHYWLNKRLLRWGLKTKATFSSSKRILDYAHVNSLPAVISYHRNHSCLFLGWYVDPRSRIITHAYVLNPNNISHIETPTYSQFMQNWIRNDGEAVVIVPTRNRRKR